MTLHHSALLACVSASAVRDQVSLQRVSLNGVFPVSASLSQVWKMHMLCNMELRPAEVYVLTTHVTSFCLLSHQSETSGPPMQVFENGASFVVASFDVALAEQEGDLISYMNELARLNSVPGSWQLCKCTANWGQVQVLSRPTAPACVLPDVCFCMLCGSVCAVSLLYQILKPCASCCLCIFSARTPMRELNKLENCIAARLCWAIAMVICLILCEQFEL